MAEVKHKWPLVASLQEYARGIAGGLIFSLPLLYTMEVWWAGFITNALAAIGFDASRFHSSAGL